MKKLEKEAVLKERMILVGAVSFFIFILPYLLHVGLHGIQPMMADSFGGIPQSISVSVSGSRESIQLENYLVGALARNSEVGYETESLKAIAIVLRSNAVCCILEERSAERDSFYTDEELRILWGREYEENLQRYRDVVTSTEGIVLFYDGEIISVPYHRLSSGVTRDSGLWQKPVPYVSSVESPEDMYADDFYEKIEIRKELLGPDFKVLFYDRFGYALQVQIKEETLQGEVFCQKYRLPSANFEYESDDEEYIFHVRGCGHGFGMSLYGADSLAGKGWSFDEILQYYYPGIEIRRENRDDVSA